MLFASHIKIFLKRFALYLVFFSVHSHKFGIIGCVVLFLQDVLYNEDIKLDWMFQISIASDLARVSNSVITSQSVIKISFVASTISSLFVLTCLCRISATKSNKTGPIENFIYMYLILERLSCKNICFK